jgi:Flp pilus assembly protein TadD
VRIEAARALAGTDLLALTPEQQTAFVKATAELVAAEIVDADRPEAHLNLGLLDLLRRAHELMPDNARYAYVYAVALNSSGAAGETLALLEEAHRQHPADRSVLMALVSIGRDNGELPAALGHARELLTLDPDNAQLQALVVELEKKTKR